MQIILSIAPAVFGYLTFHFMSTPGSKLNRWMPQIKFKKVHLFPSQKIIIRGRIIHLHHWFQFTVILIISVFVTHPILDSTITRSFLVGSILQGLKFPDRSIIKKINNEG